jgi:hypothetical protein
MVNHLRFLNHAAVEPILGLMHDLDRRLGCIAELG